MLEIIRNLAILLKLPKLLSIKHSIECLATNIDGNMNAVKFMKITILSFIWQIKWMLLLMDKNNSILPHGFIIMFWNS